MFVDRYWFPFLLQSVILTFKATKWNRIRVKIKNKRSRWPIFLKPPLSSPFLWINSIAVRIILEINFPWHSWLDFRVRYCIGPTPAAISLTWFIWLKREDKCESSTWVHISIAKIDLMYTLKAIYQKVHSIKSNWKHYLWDYLHYQQVLVFLILMETIRWREKNKRCYIGNGKEINWTVAKPLLTFFPYTTCNCKGFLSSRPKIYTNLHWQCVQN